MSTHDLRLQAHVTRPHPGLRDWLEMARPFSLTASLVPTLVGTAVAWWAGRFDPEIFVAVLLAMVLLQAGTNIVNEVFDVANGVDTPETPRASRVLVQGRIDAHTAHLVGIGCLLLTVAVGAWFTYVLHLGDIPLLLCVLGAAAGYAYMAPPLEYKYRALGTPLVFLLMGPLMVLGTEYVQAGRFTASALVASLPVGFLVAAILYSNELRDHDDDLAAGKRTLPGLLGRRAATALLFVLLLAGYVPVAIAVASAILPPSTLLALLTLPLSLHVIARLARATRNGANVLKRLDQEVALIHLTTGILLAIGLIAAASAPL